MILDLLSVFLFSISPAGEARVGIQIGIAKDIPVIWCFIVGLGANLLVFPVFHWLITVLNRFFWRYRTYKKSAVFVAKRAKKNTKKSIQKYGIWGLMVFVMIPLPVTGAYAGTIASYLLGMDYKKSFVATSIGVTISCIVVTLISYLVKNNLF